MIQILTGQIKPKSEILPDLTSFEASFYAYGWTMQSASNTAIFERTVHFRHHEYKQGNLLYKRYGTITLEIETQLYYYMAVDFEFSLRELIWELYANDIKEAGIRDLEDRSDHREDRWDVWLDVGNEQIGEWSRLLKYYSYESTKNYKARYKVYHSIGKPLTLKVYLYCRRYDGGGSSVTRFWVRLTHNWSTIKVIE